MKAIRPLPPFLPVIAFAYVSLLAASLGLAGRAAPEHPLSAPPEQRTAADILDAGRALFSKSAFRCAELGATPWSRPARTVGELWDDYICERGPASVAFAGTDALTLELAVTDAMHTIRRSFYAGGQAGLSGAYAFNLGEFVAATGDMIAKAKETQRREFSISHFLGSFEYHVRREGDRVHYFVRNQTDRSSGTRIPLRFPEQGYVATLEGLLAREPSLARRPFVELVLNPRYGLVAVLEPKTRDATDDEQDEGGGVFEQTYEWSERVLPEAERVPLAVYQRLLDIR